MDCFDRYIQMGKHKSNYDEYNGQTWDLFQKCCENKTVVVYGAGNALGIVWDRLVEEIDFIVDSNLQKQGKKADDIINNPYDAKKCDLTISDLSVLETLNKDKTLVVITILNGFEEVLEYINSLGFKYCFVALIMEANERKTNKIPSQRQEEEKDIFVTRYCEEPIQQNKIVFQSFGTYSDHGKYITEQLIKLNKNLDIVWVLTDYDEVVPEQVRIVYASAWKKYIYEMETAKVWIINTMVPNFIIKRTGQFYIHTKHWASVTLKKFYLDASTITDITESVAHWKKNGKIMDYIFSGSQFDEDSCRRGFDFNKTFIRVGSPRTDVMFCMDRCRNILQTLYPDTIESHSKLMLYAPTYRYDKNIVEQHKHISRNIEINFEMVHDALTEKFGGDWKILLRLHPSVASSSKPIIYPSYVIDVSDYSDSEELCSACDILVSDYSSIMFEPAFVYKPVFLFATDKEDYIDKEYDLLIEYDTLPFPIAESNEELVDNILQFDKEKYDKNLKAFFEEYGVHEDGHASERAADFIIKLLEKQA